MELNLKRPIAFFDLETTGLNPSHDRIVEMSVLKINVNGDEEQRVWLLNPEMPISAESTSVHGYTNEMLADKPTFKDKAKEIALFIGNADLAGYNILKFDLPMLWRRRRGCPWRRTRGRRTRCREWSGGCFAIPNAHGCIP